MSPEHPPGPDIPPPPGTRCYPDIAFGPHERQQIDLYLPPGPPRGVIAYVHGGSWLKRDRKTVRAWYMIEHGYAVASLGYRLSQHAPFPAQIRDVNAGLALLGRIAPEHGLDMGRLGIIGLSAGGHLAALAALARRNPSFGPVANPPIRALVDFYGPSNLITLCAPRDGQTGVLNPAVSQLLGRSVLEDPAAAFRASPVAYIRPDAPAVLLIHGDADSVVPVSESINLHGQLQSAGNATQLIVVPGGGHATPNMHTPEINARIAEFFDTHLAD